MFKMFLAGALMAMAAAGADAAEIEVKMLNKGATGVMVFEPALIRIAPGDTVRFVPTDKSHNAESVPEMTPDGGERFIGKLNEQVEITFKTPGAYGIKCKPHYGMGMVALVVVGEPANLEAAGTAKHPGKARQIFADLIAKAK